MVTIEQFLSQTWNSTPFYTVMNIGVMTVVEFQCGSGEIRETSTSQSTYQKGFLISIKTFWCRGHIFMTQNFLKRMIVIENTVLLIGYWDMKNRFHEDYVNIWPQKSNLNSENVTFFDGSASKVFTRYIQSFRVCLLGYKSLLNIICRTMKFLNRHHSTAGTALGIPVHGFHFNTFSRSKGSDGFGLLV